MTPFENRYDYRNTRNKGEYDKDGNPLHYADFAPTTLLRQTQFLLTAFTQACAILFAFFGVNELY
jgi:hypothetical protein